jgi:hypothetical protein
MWFGKRTHLAGCRAEPRKGCLSAHRRGLQTAASNYNSCGVVCVAFTVRGALTGVVHHCTGAVLSPCRP